MTLTKICSMCGGTKAHNFNQLYCDECVPTWLKSPSPGCEWVFVPPGEANCLGSWFERQISQLANPEPCPHCTNGIIRSLGRDNDEVLEDCPKCTAQEIITTEDLIEWMDRQDGNTPDSYVPRFHLTARHIAEAVIKIKAERAAKEKSQ